MKKQNDYFLGLDIGTGSVGWAVTDDHYNLLKANQKTLWGVKLFETANTAQERRLFRTSRRRLKRRNQRIKLLQQLFAEEISKVDPGFFLRLKESKYLPDDKLDAKGNNPNLPYTLFSDNKFTDIDFHKKYPTIYHLRHELMTNKTVTDPRLVYLALHHILKHRGHFLFESLDEDSDVQNFAECWNDFAQTLADSELEINDFGKGLEKNIENILKNKSFSVKKKLQELKSIFNVRNPIELEILNMIVGGTVQLAKLFKDDNLKEEIQKFSFRDGKYDEDSEKIESILQERFLIIAKAKAIYNWEVLTEILNDCKTLSEAKIKTYNKHKEDLSLLKKLSKKLDSTNKLYQNIFGITTEKGHFNYSTYVGFQKKGSEKIPIEKIASKNDFYIFLKKALKEYDKNTKVAKIIEEIELGIFLPKQVIRDNGVIPYQLHLKELKTILTKAETYLDYLKEKNEKGLSASDKIISVFKFRIPYYVGPLSANGSKNDFAWIEKKSQKNIYPWNFNEVVDLEQSAENFIRRMTNKCTYLTGEDVLPKNSLLYSEFTILNELNNLRINGERINPKLKTKIFEELFKRNKKVTMKKLKEYLKCEGVLSSDDEISGTDGDFKSSYGSFMDFKQLGLIEILFNDEIENLISDITIFLDDKKILKGRIKARLSHHKNITEKQINGVCKLTYKDWGRLSKRFLTDIEGTERETGEITSIINFMRNYSKNLMEISESYNYSFQENIENYNKELSPNMTLNYSTVKELYVSPSVKRSIWQTIKIVKELKKVMKSEPKKIFVEIARENKESRRTESRKTKLIELYKSCKKEEADLYEAIEKGEDHQFRSDRLYLYFIQKGRCLYTGDAISLDNLYSSNIYDTDHIYPQSKVTDDSLDNRVLVKKDANSKKTDIYPLSNDIQSKNKAFWNSLRESGLMSQEKFNRLTRTTPFNNDELSGFINRQIVETRQSTKAVANILKQVFPDTEIVYVKAKNVSKFRQDFKIIKVREINDLHHAKDAFLNIVVGNVYNTKFTNNVFNFMKEAKYREYNLNKLFIQKDIERKDYIAWKVGEEGTIKKIKKTMNKNNILVVRKSEKRNGGLFKQNILKKGKGQLPIKSLDLRLQNKEKYGAYNEVKGSYFFIVESLIKGQKNITIEFIPIYLAPKLENNNSALLEFCKTELKLIEPRILISKIKIKSQFIINNSSVYIAGRTTDYIEFHNASQLLCNNSEEEIIKKIVKYNTRLVDNPKLTISKKDELTNEDLIMIYKLFIKKLSLNQYSFIRKNELNKLSDKKIEDNFISLLPENKAKVLFQIMKLFSSVARINLSDIDGAKECGRIIISKNISKLESVYIVYSSTTGIFEQKVDLLKL